MAKAVAETVTLRLEQEIDRAADAATGALSRLERQIEREQNSLGRLERSLLDAKAKLDTMSTGAPSAKAVAAFDKQSAAVAVLEAKLSTAKTALAELGSSGGDAKAINRHTAAIDQMQAKLVEARAKMDALSGPASGGVVDVAAYRKQRDAVAALTDKVAAQKDKIQDLRTAGLQTKNGTDQLSGAVQYLGTKLGVSSGQSATFARELIALGPYGAAAAAAILVTVGALSAFVAIVSKGINAAGAMRSELLQLQSSSVSSSMGMHWLFNATRESWVQADKLQASIDRVNASSSLGRAKLAEYASQIRAARFQGADAEKVLKAMSIAGSAGSQSMAQEVLAWSKAMRFAGGDVDGLAKRVEQKLVKTAAAQAIALDVQLRRLGENITRIFGGADIDPFLKAVDSVLRLFGAGSDSATSMRNAVTSLVEWSIGGMLRLGIAVLRAYIALRQNETAWNTITALVKIAAIGFAIVAGAVIGTVAAIVAINAAMLVLGLTIAGAIGNVLYKLATVIGSFYGKAFEIGTAIVTGIANGITRAGSAIWDALKSTVGGSVSKVRDYLGIKSPSKLFFGFGGYMAQGMAGGIAKGEAQVSAASVHMADRAATGASEMSDVFAERPAIEPKAKSQQASPISMEYKPQSASNSKSVSFSNCTFGSGVTEGVVRQWVLAAFEADALSAGMAV